ncbi:hypothetical protein J8Z86_22145, partial [Yersinia enterocolitica]|nr:hypothetical protein [Yersinia enterocolitica]
MIRPLQADYSQRLTALRDQHALTGDINAFRQALRSLNHEFAQAARAEAHARSQARLSAMQASNGLDGLLGPLSGLAVGFIALQKAMQFFQDSLVEGAKRTQAKTMLKTAFGDDAQVITEAINTYASKYGADQATAQQQASQLRMTLPENVLTNADVPRLLETESVFAHQAGMTTQQQQGVNYLFAQEAAAAKGGTGNNWRQLTENMPAVIKPLMELTGKRNSAELRDLAHTMSGAEWVKTIIKAMDLLNTKSGAAVAAQNNVLAAQGRYSNAVKGAQEQLFKGYESGFKNMMDSMSNSLNGSNALFEDAGKVLGWFFNRIADIVQVLGTVAINVHGYLQLISE